MKINVVGTVKGYDGNDLFNNTINSKGESSKKPLIYRDILSTVLNSVLPNEVFTVDQKAKLFQLSVKIYASDEVDLSIEEAFLIKSRAEKVYNSPLFYGRICALFDDKVETPVVTTPPVVEASEQK